jgi:anaerobic magnesium-protoporphyrin IX monomethyl ester cyclase
MPAMPKRESLDLLLVHPGGRAAIYQSLGNTLAAIEPPFWAGLMATFIRRHGFSVEILDANAENLGPEQAADRVKERSPRLTAVVVYGHNPSASTQVMPFAGDFCRFLKEKSPDSKVILAGGHAAALPERTLREEETDFVAGGEGPCTLLDLLRAFQSPLPDLGKVRSLWYRENGHVRTTEPAPLITDLDGEMPEVAWDLLPMEKYRAHNWHCFGFLDRRQPYASLYTTLGCPFHCSYCCIQAPFKSGEKALGYKETVNSYRLWSPSSVIAQIDKLVNRYGVRNIKFADELFVMNKKHVHGICDLIIERGYDLNIWAYARVDTLRDDETMEKLKRAGVHWLCLGFESGSKRVRDDVKKGYSQEEAYKVVERLGKARIYIIANFLFGLPEDDLESMQETLDLALDFNCEFANFYSAMAYPGSQLYQTALQEGWPLPKSWSGYSQHAVDTLPLPTKYIPGTEVLSFRDRAFHLYFCNPAYLERIGQRFDCQTVQHIHNMLAYKLRRDKQSMKEIHGQEYSRKAFSGV